MMTCIFNPCFTENSDVSAQSLQAVSFLNYGDLDGVATAVSTFAFFNKATWTSDKIDAALKIPVPRQLEAVTC